MIEQGLEQYGYLILIPGIVVEGDATVLAAAFLSHQGVLNLGTVICVSALASTLLNHLLFIFGHRWGRPMFDRQCAKRPKLKKLEGKFSRCQVPILLFSRFLWGLRLATVCLASISGVPLLLFSLLDILGAFLWASVLGGVGYYFGHMLDALIADFQRYDQYVAVGVFVAVALAYWRTRAHRRRTLQSA
jgi:membrane protein DedA with SNARE-associated domain